MSYGYCEYDDDNEVAINRINLRRKNYRESEDDDYINYYGPASGRISASDLERVERTRHVINQIRHCRDEQRTQMVDFGARDQLQQDTQQLHNEQSEWNRQLADRQGRLHGVNQQVVVAKQALAQCNQDASRLAEQIDLARQTLASLEGAVAEATLRMDSLKINEKKDDDNAATAASAPGGAPHIIDKDTCSICCEMLDTKLPQHSLGEVVETACHHQLHRAWLARWVIKQNSCPLCRAVLLG